MRELVELPLPPDARLELVEDRSERTGGFLRRVSRLLVAETSDGKVSAPFVYDEVDRRALDAVVVVPFYEARGAVWVVLRSAVRPPVALRPAERSPIDEPACRALWEVPAGLVEPDEISPAGLRRAALRELHEETGFIASDEALFALGPSSFPCPGVIAERHFYFGVRIDPTRAGVPPLDGSVLEAIGEVIAVPIEVLLAAARAGLLSDAKTELGLRRLEEQLAASSEGAP